MAELELMAWAEKSNRAESGGLELEIFYAAMAACWGKNGEAIIKKMREALRKQVYE